ncbi:MAG: L,D-transpeptidase [Rhizobiaceae bacterium]
MKGKRDFETLVRAVSVHVPTKRMFDPLVGVQIVRILLIAMAMVCLGVPASAATGMQFDAQSGRWIEKEVPETRKSARFASRKIVMFAKKMRRGTVFIDTKSRALFHVLGKGRAMKYSIGVGREGFAWKGRERISRKEEWPAWTPPAEMRAREAAKGNLLPKRMPGGPENPLGARALYLGNTLFRIHGTNQPATIGRAVSSGCIRMDNDDVVHLFDRVKTGTLVVVH